MLTTAIRLLVTLFLSVALLACGDKVPRMDVEVNVTLNGKPLPHAKINMDGKLLGESGDDGQFNSSMKEQPGKQVVMESTIELAGYEIQPWKSEFTVKLPNEGEILKYVFDADIKGTPFVMMAVQEKGVPIPGATISIDNKEAGKTDAQGIFTYKYLSDEKQSALIEVSKAGYSTWKKSAKLEPGYKFGIDITKKVAVTFEALKDEYGSEAGIAGVVITVDGKPVGKTNDMGVLTINYDGTAGKPSKVSYKAAGYLPAQWNASVVLDGGAAIRHSFHPVASRPLKVAFFHFGGNTPGVDLKDIATQAQTALRTQLFKNSVFREVSGDTLDKELKRAGLNMGKLTSKGWERTRLQSMADLVVLGSVSKDAKGYVIEAKFHAASGKQIYSQLVHADDRSDINNAAKEMATHVMERFPFEGTVIAVKDSLYEINLGKAYSISRGTEFEPIAGTAAANVLLSVKKTGDSSSSAGVDEAQPGVKVALGDRVVRRVQREGEVSTRPSSVRESFALTVKGGAGKDATPLAGVSIYLNNDWVGSTGSDGKAKVIIRTGKNFNLMLYRHGYQQVTEKIKIDKSGESKSFVMAANYSVFKLESSPSPATVYIDGELLGKTPMADGRQLSLGFHTVRLTAGENYRSWEEVVEFDKKIEDRTGARKIVLYKDYLKIGEAAEAKGNIDAAIAAYAATVKGHPDYSDAHHRLAQIYLDEKNDFNGAIREFENVLSLPENEQLIFKQYSVTYTNLGHAYYEKGNSKMSENRNEAAQYYAKALQNLKIAKQNTRFFPADEYDQAVHDTYYYLALSYQKLYMITNRSNMLNDANLAWRDYFDFFPRALENDPVFTQHRDTGKKFWAQIKDK